MEEKKLVPKLRFPGFTEPWEQRKLSEVVTINPKTELPDEFKYVDLESVVGTNLLGFQVIKKENAPSRAQRLASYGDVFYQTVRPYQRNNYLFENVDKDMVFSTGYAQLRSKLDSYFLLTLVQNDNFVKVVLDNCTGTSYPAINGSELGKITVQIPPNEAEADQIGKVFRGIDKSITLHQRKLEHLKLKKKSLLQKLFPKEGEVYPELRFPGFTDPWEQRKLSEITTCFDNLRVPVTASDRVSGKTPYYGANGIQDYVSGNTHSGEFVLIAEDGANDLNDYPVQYVNGEIWVNNHAHVIAGFKEKLDNKFLSYALKTVKMTTFIVGSGRSKLNLKALLEIPISMPNYNEQCFVGRFIDKIDTNITLHQRKLEHLQLLKKALLQQLFV